eukprot:scaffold107242_cov14-Tisochrysis_lutea.AAC.1
MSSLPSLKNANCLKTLPSAPIPVGTLTDSQVEQGRLKWVELAWVRELFHVVAEGHRQFLKGTRGIKSTLHEIKKLQM